jgi:hypothetical protein
MFRKKIKKENLYLSGICNKKKEGKGPILVSSPNIEDS